MVYGLVNLFRILGLTTVAAYALAILIIENRALTLEELSRKTGYAKSCVHTHLRTLVARGLVDSIRRGRRVKYRARIDGIRKLLHDYFESLKKHLSLAAKTECEPRTNELLKHVADEVSSMVERIKNVLGEYSE
ncbi:MAG: helix-turn-helix domain-containing protein [Thermoprotei archaeon]